MRNGDHGFYAETQKELETKLRASRRCYCEQCTDEDFVNSNLPRTAEGEVHHLRRVLAEANKIPLDGSEENEAKIDALLEGKDT